jgi:hypothetical protein
MPLDEQIDAVTAECAERAEQGNRQGDGHRGSFRLA